MRINYQRCGTLNTIPTCHVSDAWRISHSTESFEACITKNVVIACIGMWPTLIVFQQSPTHWLLHLICQNHHGKVKQWITSDTLALQVKVQLCWDVLKLQFNVWNLSFIFSETDLQKSLCFLFVETLQAYIHYDFERWINF